MKHILPTDTVNKILNYLATKAFSEVNALIVEIQRVAVVFKDPEEKKAEIDQPVPAIANAKK